LRVRDNCRSIGNTNFAFAARDTTASLFTACLVTFLHSRDAHVEQPFDRVKRALVSAADFVTACCGIATPRVGRIWLWNEARFLVTREVPATSDIEDAGVLRNEYKIIQGAVLRGSVRVAVAGEHHRIEQLVVLIVTGHS
jgi:hypothetical protein